MGKTETKYTTSKLELHSKAVEEKQNVPTTDNLPSFNLPLQSFDKLKAFWTAVNLDIHVSTSAR